MSLGQAVGTVVGAVVGFFSGGPAGALKGAYIGYTMGTLVDPPPGPNMQGPRLSDLVAQTSLDGAPLARVFGTARIAGNVIWSTGLEEVATTEEQGGGSGGGGATMTTYTYKTDVAVALCEGEITGVRRIWADTKLIYDMSDTASIETLVGSSARYADLRVYTGSETQSADALIQAIEGAANAPAFLGTAYIVIEDLQLADFGNRLPNFTFEVVSNGALTITNTNYNNTTNIANTYSLRAPYYNADGLHMINCLGSIWSHYLLIPGQTNATLIETQPITASTLPNYYPSTHDITDEVGKFMIMDASSGNINYQGYENGNFVDKTWNTLSIGNIIATGACKKAANYLFAGIDTTSGYHLGAIYNGVKLTNMPVVVNNGARNVCYIGSSSLLIYHDFYVYRFDLSLNYLDSFYLGNSVYVSNFIDDINFFTINSAGVVNYCTITGPSTFASIYKFTASNIASASPSNTIAIIHPLDSSGRNFIGFFPSYASIENITISTAVLTSSAVSIKSITDALCSETLFATDYDHAALTADSVRGYVVGRPMSARAALEPLQQAYHFDLAEIDGKIKAVKRGGAVVKTLADDDLGADENPASDRVTGTRANESELPSEVVVTYSDIDNDYQPGTQYARRLTANHTNQLQVNLPIVLTSTEATRVADVLLNQAWVAGRIQYKFTATYEHARLVPTDVIDVPAFGVTQRMRVTGIDIGSPGLVVVDAVPELAGLYTSSVVGADATGIGQSLAVGGPTLLSLLDCVMLRDEDTSAGWYVGLSGYNAGWPGGLLFKSSDGGATYTQALIATRAQATTSGYATTALATADCRVWDRANTVTVMLTSGTLSSTTEANLLNGANAALLGAAGRWELIQFQTATLNGDGSYTLRDLLRGRRGTEYAAASHAAYDRFILLSTTTLQNLAAPTSEIGAARQFKAVTSGKLLEETGSETYTYAGERLECLAPVLLGGGRDASGNITINWVRRDRINAGWNNYSDVPMSEASEAYEVEVYTSSAYTTLKRTLTGITSATTTYSSANQVTDFGSNQATVYLRVYQLSATVGRGHYLQGTV